MPRDIHVSWTVQPATFDPGTPMAADYLVATDAPEIAAVQVPYGGPHECDLLDMPTGLWTVTAQLQEPDGSMIGVKLTGEIEIQPDDVVMDEPLMLTLAVVPDA